MTTETIRPGEEPRVEGEEAGPEQGGGADAES